MNRSSHPAWILLSALAILVQSIVTSTDAQAQTRDIADCNQMQDPDRGIAGCTRALNSAKGVQKAIGYNLRGMHWADKGDNARAIADFTESIRINPNDPWPLSNRANAFSDNGELDRAIQDVDRAIELAPTNSAFYANRCEMWTSKGLPDRAITDCDKAIRLDPKAPGPFIHRGLAWFEKGELDRAIADADAAIQRGMSTYQPYNNRGLAWQKRGNLDRAMADFNQAIRIDPKAGQVWANRGELRRLTGDLVAALSDYDEAIRLRPKSARAYVGRGDIFRYKGEFAQALSDYNRALQFYPEYIPALTGRGFTLERMGDLAGARAEFTKALASRSPYARSDISREARETAQARVDAINSGGAQPAILPAPAKASSTTTIPTPATPISVAPSVPINVQGRRVALVIGNSRYRNVPALANPHNDAEAIASALRKTGFHSVKLVNDTTRENLVSGLRAFAEEVESADWAVVYYAGHGIELNGQNYLIPVDARLAADRDVQFETIPLGQVLAALEGAKRLRMVLLDACRVNPFKQQMRPTEAVTAAAALESASSGGAGARSVGRGLARVEVRAGPTLVVFAAKDGQIALDGDGPNSPFAIAMVQRIATPGVEINKIFRLVRDDVMEATAGRQEPYTYGSLPGREDFFFMAK